MDLGSTSNRAAKARGGEGAEGGFGVGVRVAWEEVKGKESDTLVSF